MQRSTAFLPALLSAGLCLPAALPARANDTPAGALVATDAPAARPQISVCADPDNLPYSDRDHPGFENRIAALLAADLHADLTYHWQRSYRAFLRRTLIAGRCDVVMGVPTSLQGLAVTRPYYASTYVAITRDDDRRHFESFDNDWLKDAKIGVQLIGAEDSATPPQSALAARNISAHITGYAMRTSGPEINPQGRIVDAVASGDVDVAFVWGPIAGYFAKGHGGALKLDRITDDPQHSSITFIYPMSVGVRQDSIVLRDRLQGALDRHKGEIAVILANYGIPVVPVPAVVPVPPAPPALAQKVAAKMPDPSSQTH